MSNELSALYENMLRFRKNMDDRADDECETWLESSEDFEHNASTPGFDPDWFSYVIVCGTRRLLKKTTLTLMKQHSSPQFQIITYDGLFERLLSRIC